MQNERESIWVDAPVRQLPVESRFRLAGLSPREGQACLLASRGLTVREIAGEMQVSVGTVKTLLARARQKLGCRNVRELSAALFRKAILHAGDHSNVS